MNAIISRMVQGWPTIVTIVGLSLVAVVGYSTRDKWMPFANELVQGKSEEDEHDDDHEESDHAHDHEEQPAVELSDAGLRNIKYEPFTVTLGTFERTITVPATVVEQPGKSQRHVSAHLTGIVTRIVPAEGAAVEPGGLMFEVHLTHEELVTGQRDFLETAERVAVVEREIARLKNITEGILAGKRLLEQEYELQQLMAKFNAQRQALRLHGLNDDQLDGILQHGTLLDSLSVYAPLNESDSEHCDMQHPYHVQSLPVTLGQHVEAGQTLCILGDHCELLIEGRAFENDAGLLRRVANQNLSITGRLNQSAESEDEIRGLKLMYLADHIDSESRALHFYLQLPNHIVLDRTNASGQRFIAWNFSPGQRMDLRIPVERWEQTLVVPVEAVVEEGAESYVYEQNGDHFEQVPVHVEYRDRDWAVIANTGAVWPGDVIAGKGAYQMHLFLKNQSGGAIDPHAGHSH